MGRVPKQPFPDAVRSAWDSGMPFGSDERVRRKKHAPAMLYTLAKTPDGQRYLEEMAAWLASQDMAKVRPVAQGAERAVFEDGDRVVKVGTGRVVGTKDYVPPTGVWGVTPWLADTQVGPYRLEIQPRVELHDPTMGGTVRRKPGYADIRALREALWQQGWNWTDNHPGNIGFVPGSEYRPTVIDGPVYSTTTPMLRADLAAIAPPGTVPRQFIPPTKPAWLAALLATIAAGASSTSKANETVTAGADEKLADYLRRMQPTQTPANEPGIADAAAEVGTEIGQQVLPYYAQQMAGIAKPIHTYPKDFPEMGEFRERLDVALEKPVIRDGDRLLSPAEYAAREVYGDDVSPPQIAMVRQIMAGQLSGDQPEPALAGVIKNTLLTLRRQSIGGPDAEFPGQTLAQREARRTSPLQEGRYMTSPGLDANLAATRAYNILSTMQTDPDIMPPTADMGSGFLPLIGASLAGALNPSGDEGTVASDTWEQFENRNFGSAANPAQSRVIEALNNERLAEQGEFSGQYRSGITGGYYPQSSWTNPTGMSRQGGMDNANLNTFLSETVLPQAFSGTPILSDFPSKTLTEIPEGFPGKQPGQSDAPIIRRLARDLLREVPVVPEGADSEEIEGVRQKLSSYFGSQDDQFKHNYPMYQRSWNDAMQKIGATGMKVDKFSFPSPLLNSVVNAPKYWLDPMTVGTLGAALPLSMAKGSLIPLLRSVAKDFVLDQRFEQPFGMGLHMANEPYRSKPANLLAPYEDGFEAGGQKVGPNDPDYGKLRQQFEDEQKKLLGEAIEFGQRYYRPGGTPPPQR